RLADVLRADEARDPALQPDREAAVRRHPVLERLQVAVERRGILPGCGERSEVLLVAMQPLSACRQLEPAEDQVEAVRELRTTRIRMRVEGTLRQRETGDEHEVRAVLPLRPLPEQTLVRRSQIELSLDPDELQRGWKVDGRNLVRHIR